jgi:hypothetical protein
MTWHVLPLNDFKEHEESMTCWCEPLVQTGDDNGAYAEPLVIHNSADGREWHERFAKAFIRLTYQTGMVS